MDFWKSKEKLFLIFVLLSVCVLLMCWRLVANYLPVLALKLYSGKGQNSKLRQELKAVRWLCSWMLTGKIEDGNYADNGKGNQTVMIGYVCWIDFGWGLWSILDFNSLDGF